MNPGGRRAVVPAPLWWVPVREQLLDYGRLLALGQELLETLRVYPGPAKLKDLSRRRGEVLRSLKSRAERMEAEGLWPPGRAEGGVPPGARAELRRALEAVQEVETQCRKLHEEHLERLRGALQDLQRSRQFVRAYKPSASVSARLARGRVNLSG